MLEKWQYFVYFHKHCFIVSAIARGMQHSTQHTLANELVKLKQIIFLHFWNTMYKDKLTLFRVVFFAFSITKWNNLLHDLLQTINNFNFSNFQSTYYDHGLPLRLSTVQLQQRCLPSKITVGGGQAVHPTTDGDTLPSRLHTAIMGRWGLIWKAPYNSTFVRSSNLSPTQNLYIESLKKEEEENSQHCLQCVRVSNQWNGGTLIFSYSHIQQERTAEYLLYSFEPWPGGKWSETQHMQQSLCFLPGVLIRLHISKSLI